MLRQRCEGRIARVALRSVARRGAWRVRGAREVPDTGLAIVDVAAVVVTVTMGCRVTNGGKSGSAMDNGAGGTATERAIFNVTVDVVTATATVTTATTDMGGWSPVGGGTVGPMGGRSMGPAKPAGNGALGPGGRGPTGPAGPETGLGFRRRFGRSSGKPADTPT